MEKGTEEKACHYVCQDSNQSFIVEWEALSIEGYKKQEM